MTCTTIFPDHRHPPHYDHYHQRSNITLLNNKKYMVMSKTGTFASAAAAYNKLSFHPPSTPPFSQSHKLVDIIIS